MATRGAKDACDLLDADHRAVKKMFKEYEELLGAWCRSPFTHPKARAVLAYVRKHRVVADLVNEKILHVGADGKLLTLWRSEEKS